MSDDELLHTINLSDEEIERIKTDIGVTEEPDAATPPMPIEPPARRRPGRPKGSRNKRALARAAAVDEEDDASSESPGAFPPATLTKRDEKEVATRLVKIFTGATGIGASFTKPYVEMTEEEARDIADPLASYLVRNADTIPVAREILENYDLAAIALGTTAYVGRVYSDRKKELETHGRDTRREIFERTQARVPEPTDEETTVSGSTSPVSVPFVAGTVRSGPPFD
jgi:hypothetical protein